MNYSIEFATPNDAKELLSIYAPYVLNTTITFEYDVPSIEEFTSRIETISKTYPYLVYRVDGVIAGYAYATVFRTRTAFMWDVETSVYIKEEFQHTGAAHKLYTVLINLLKEQGFYTIYAYISVPNDKSVRFHEKHGFETTASYPNTGYKLDQWCHLICMTKQLKEITEATKPLPYKTIHQLDSALISTLLQL